MSLPNETRIKNLEALVGAATPDGSGTGFLIGVTAGTAAAGKALVLDSSGQIGTITTATITSLTTTTLTGTTGNITTVNATTVAATTVTAGTVTPTAINVPLTVYCTTECDVATSTALVAIIGMSATVVAGTYDFEAELFGTAGASGGWKVAFALTTAVLSAINTSGFAWVTATAPAITNNTTTTSGTTILADTAAVTNGRIVGRLTFSTGGTFALQFAQNASNGTTSSIYVGSKMRLIRTA